MEYLKKNNNRPCIIEKKMVMSWLSSQTMFQLSVNTVLGIKLNLGLSFKYGFIYFNVENCIHRS